MNWKKIWLLIFFASQSFVSAQEFVEGTLMGQLGNQMFIIAATYSVAMDHGAEAIFPDLENVKEYNIPLNREKIFSRLDSSSAPRPTQYIFREKGYEYSPIPYYPDMRIFGYFQSEKYFIHHKNEILNLFAPPKDIHDYLSAHFPEILNHSSTVSVHLRSYFKEDPDGRYHITYGKDYFEKAISLFPEECLFVVFSNHMEWCKQELSDINRKLIFVENEPHYHDFYLMSMCHHHIVCNSSFSWWAAYLNRNPDKIVVAPKLWFNPRTGLNTKDLIPEEWLIVD